jgi:hypothetical protein
MCTDTGGVLGISWLRSSDVESLMLKSIGVVVNNGSFICFLRWSAAADECVYQLAKDHTIVIEVLGEALKPKFL